MERIKIIQSPCPNCKGGKIYWAYNHIDNVSKQVTPETWSALPGNDNAAERLGLKWSRDLVEICSECEGTGFIDEELDLTPDWSEIREERYADA